MRFLYLFQRERNILIKLRFSTGFNLDSEEKRKFMGVETQNTPLGLGEVYSNEIELGESITETSYY